jgi:hypothetical protein
MAIQGIPLTSLRSEDHNLNRVQDRLIAALNPLLNAQLKWINIGDSGAPAFQNGWAVFVAKAKDGTSLYAPPAYSKDAFGTVRLRGALKGGTAATGFILPPGYRPAFRMSFVTMGSAGPSTAIALRTDVLAKDVSSAFLAGTVLQVSTLVPANGATADFWFLDGISFVAEN